jgi:hypothetical protein
VEVQSSARPRRHLDLGGPALLGLVRKGRRHGGARQPVATKVEAEQRQGGLRREATRREATGRPPHRRLWRRRRRGGEDVVGVPNFLPHRAHVVPPALSWIRGIEGFGEGIHRGGARDIGDGILGEEEARERAEGSDPEMVERSRSQRRSAVAWVWQPAPVGRGGARVGGDGLTAGDGGGRLLWRGGFSLCGDLWSAGTSEVCLARIAGAGATFHQRR